MNPFQTHRSRWRALFRLPTGGGLFLGCLTLTTGLAACSVQQPSAAESQRSTASQAPPDEPDLLATVGDDQITMAHVRERAGDDLDQMLSRYQRARHKLIETTLQEIVRDRVLLEEAKKQNQTVDQLIAAEAGGSLDPSDVEVAAWYQENQSRTGGRSLEQIRTQIADYLRTERRKQASMTLEQRLNQERKVTIHLEPFRLQLNNEHAPAAGLPDAPVTLVEFSDFQCPFCGRFFPTLKQVQQKYGDRLRVVYRQFPLTSIHPYAFKAAEASLCAHEQGKFWEMHDLLFQEQERLAVKDLKVKAGRLGLNQTKFDACLDSGRFAEQIQEDLKEGNRAGVSGTPSLFLNGLPVDGGAVPYDVIAKAIDQELERVKR